MGDKYIEIPKAVREWINRLSGYDGIEIEDNTFTNQEHWLLSRTTAQILEYATLRPFWTCPLYKRSKKTECDLNCEEKCGSSECSMVFKKWAMTPINAVK